MIGDVEEELLVMGTMTDDDETSVVTAPLVAVVIFNGDDDDPFVDVDDCCDGNVLVSELDCVGGGGWVELLLFLVTCGGVGDVEMRDGHELVCVILTSCLAVKFPAKNLNASVLELKDLKKDPVYPSMFAISSNMLV